MHAIKKKRLFVYAALPHAFLRLAVHVVNGVNETEGEFITYMPKTHSSTNIYAYVVRMYLSKLIMSFEH